MNQELDSLWLKTARQIGFAVRRSREAYAAFDGRGGLLIGSDDTLDADDTVAQLVLHELCHAAVQGPEHFERADWGLDNQTPSSATQEHACLRLQASLLAPYGLRATLAPTTEHRRYYFDLSSEPLAGDGEAQRLARRGRVQVERSPFAPHLVQAIAATEKLMRRSCPPTGAGGQGLAPVEEGRAPHPSGFWNMAAEGGLGPSLPTCGNCAWATSTGSSEHVVGCRKASVPIAAADPACERFEPTLLCGDCGACCREAFDVVELSASDRFRAKRSPALRPLLRREGSRWTLPRVAGKCGALQDDASQPERYRCLAYRERPSSCRDFEAGSDNCLEARKRVGLSW